MQVGEGGVQEEGALGGQCGVLCIMRLVPGRFKAVAGEVPVPCDGYSFHWDGPDGSAPFISFSLGPVSPAWYRCGAETEMYEDRC
jgi:hypothetical protein